MHVGEPEHAGVSCRGYLALRGDRATVEEPVDCGVDSWGWLNNYSARIYILTVYKFIERLNTVIEHIEYCH